MASIVLPQVLVFQEFTAVPTELTEPLRAFIFGPEYKLHRYTETTEKVKAGEYDYTLGNTLAWLEDLGRQAGSTVDQSYTKVYLENAKLKYWEDTAGAQSTGASYSSPDATFINTPEDERNKVTLGLDGDYALTEDNGYVLPSAFYNRPVALGDYAELSLTLNGTTYTGGGTIIGLEAELIDSVIDAGVEATSNKDSQIAAGPSVTTDAGSDALVAGGTYDGTKVGVLNETYTITCIKASTGGNPSTALFNVVSASGKDTVLGYRPTATSFATAMPIGDNGLTMTITPADTNVALDSEWTVTVSQVFTKPNVTSGPAAPNSYTGSESTTYVITIIQGGDSSSGTVADQPLAQVTTINGVDGAPPVRVSGSAGANTIDVGNFGVTATWDQTVLCANDKYYIDVTAQTDGPVRTLVLDRSLPTEMVSDSTDTWDLSIKLFIQKDMELPGQLYNLGLTNWDQDADNLTINSGAQDYDSTWRSGEYALPIEGGDIYVHWRELVTDHSDKVYTVESVTDVSDVFDTQLDPDNPLAYGAYKALQNSGSESAPSTSIRVMGVSADTVAGYTAVLNAAEIRDDVYTFVPLTQNRTIQDLVAAHVRNMSTPETGLWRIAFVSTPEVDPSPIVQTNSDGSIVKMTTDANKFVDLDSSSDVEFITDGVLPGDKLRINYAQDLYGEETYEEYEIDLVLAEDRLKLVTAPETPVELASKAQIWRDLDADGTVEYIGEKASTFASRRVYNVFPGEASVSGTFVPGYYLCCAIAGIIGSVAPQQGLTNIEIVGFDDMDNVVDRFSRTQLDTLANYGVWIVTHDMLGVVHTRHQLSTDIDSLNDRELNVVKNVDSISYFFKNRLKPFIGRANVTPTAIEVIRTYVDGGISFLRGSSFNELIGGQVLDGTAIRELRQHTLLRDRLVVTIDLVVPYPLNNIELHLVV